MAVKWSNYILMVNLTVWLLTYTNNETLHIIWKFDLSPWGVLGRIYTLSIEVLNEQGHKNPTQLHMWTAYMHSDQF